MKLAGILILLGAQLLGECLHGVLHVPLPGPVLGMFLLVLVLLRWPGWQGKNPTQPSPLMASSSALIENMGLLFVPAGVGIVSELDVLRHDWLIIVLALLVSTCSGLVVTALVMQRLSGAVRPESAEATC